jgi:shikimate dehydrogenase
MTDLYAVFGNPIAHSKSPAIHAAFAEQTGQDLAYERILAPVDGFVAAVDAFRRGGGLGANVTVPFKVDAYVLAADHSERARAAKAVNTLAWRGDHWFGDNTDGVGLVTDLRNLGVALAGRAILVLGAGGAVRGVLHPLLAQAPRRLVIANRTLLTAQELAGWFADYRVVEAAAIPDVAGQSFDLVVNATSAAHLGGPQPEWPAGVLAGGGFAYDMHYGYGPTLFERWARDNGAGGTSDGLGMLVEQAAESFFVWRGMRPDTAPVIARLREAAAG